MKGLREKQKEKRYRTIIIAALSLIGEKGYQATTIEEIADRAEVGVGTVYNYFHNKAEIIISLYKNDVAENLKNGQVFIASAPGKFEDRLAKLLVIYAAGYFAKREKSLLREIYSVIMSEQALARQELLQLDFTLVEQLAELLAEAQRSHYIRPTVDPQEAASMLFSLAMYDFILFLTDDLMPFAELEKTLNRHINIVFAGLSSQGGRNE